MNPTEIKLISNRFDDFEKHFDRRLDDHEKRIEEQISNCQILCAIKFEDVENNTKENTKDISKIKSWKSYVNGALAVILFLIPIGLFLWEKIFP